MAEYIAFDDILVRHLIEFCYDTSDSIGFDVPHYLFKIEHSIHYKALVSNDYTDYALLIHTTNQQEHTLDEYLKLINTFDKSRLYEDRLSLSWDAAYKKYIVLDGCHRLAIIKYSGIGKGGKIPIEWFNIVESDIDERSVNREGEIKLELEASTGKAFYNGWNTQRMPYGYHSYNIEGMNIIGQRNPRVRLNAISKFLSFEDKNVLDLGCNVGAMLHHLSPILKAGIGIDYDEKSLTAANNISKILEIDNLDFYKHDFDKDGYDVLKTKIHFKPDIIFLLSLGSWVKTWRELYQTCLEYNANIVLETNNDSEGTSQLDFFERQGREVQLISDNSKDDITGNNRRKTYLVQNDNN